ncbi:MAG TPA: glycosyltransferase family 4 protein, partial [Candidatus Saccharimonadales bacterium]|nr:glycosyltransferase family 4 protein [Candidatus Saccharimonadales bacterium]
AMRTELVKRGHDVKIITPQPKDTKGCDTEGIIFVGQATDFHSPLHTTTQLSASSDLEALEQMLETEQFDVLHFHEPWVPMLSRQILTRSNCVNVATFHAKVPETLMSRTVVKVVTPYLKSVLKYLDNLTAVSDAAAEYVSGLTDEPISIIPNGIDLKHYKRAPKRRSKRAQKSILYIGRLERRKGVKYLLEAYELLAQDLEDVSLIIAGDGPDREKLELMVEERNLPNVTFLGYVTDEEKLQLLSEVDLFCSPAIFGESFGIVLLEAMASGLVTIAGNNSGYAAVMQELGALSLVNPHDREEFARRLRLLLTEDELRSMWREWAIKYVRRFSYSNIVSQYEDLYALAVSQHQTRMALQADRDNKKHERESLITGDNLQ